MNHHFYMGCALELAEQARRCQEVPVGAVVVDENGKIVGRACNFVECYRSQNYHAEVLAIKQASFARVDWRLTGCWLYVTLEPCLMCLGLIGLSRLEGVVYGATSPDFGGIKMLQGREKNIYMKDLLVISGCREQECVKLLQDTFRLAKKID